MKELLNKLIKKGRVPFWDKRITNVKWDMQYVWTYNWVFWSNHNVVQFWKSTREIVSKESGLWQFCCENGMIKKNDDVRIKNYWWDNECDNNYCYDEYEFWLIESALKDESELESFILDNIKIWNGD